MLVESKKKKKKKMRFDKSRNGTKRKGAEIGRKNLISESNEYIIWEKSYMYIIIILCRYWYNNILRI